MFQCQHENCTKSYDKEWKLKEHHCSHTGERPFKCNEEGCDKTFIRKCHLQRHSLAHTDEKPFVCKTCNSSFKLSSNLRKHERLHEGIRNYSCTVEKCDISFVKKTQLYKHLKVTHGVLTPFTCDVCNGNFTSHSHLLRHQERAHFSQFMCTDCGETFEKFSALNKHISKSHKKKRHGSDSLDTQTHTEIVTLQQVLSQSSSVADNQISGEVCTPLQVKCPSCDLTVKSKSLLSSHMKDGHNQHLRIDYQCSECDTIFSQKSNLVSHMLSKHHGLKRFTCDECTSQFYHKHALTRHKNARHSGKKASPRKAWNKISDLEHLSGHIVDHRLREYVKDMRESQITSSSNENVQVPTC